MTQTGYFLPQWDKDLIAAGYYRNVFSMGTVLDRYHEIGYVPWSLKGNGGIHSTTGDMYKWYLALKSNSILSKASFEKLTTPYILEYEGYESYYAYGWTIYSSEDNTKIISHNGGNSVFFHDFIWRPEEDVLILLFTNAASREVEVAWSIDKILFDESYQVPAIKKNLLYLVFDFMENNDINRSTDLITIIREEYQTAIKRSEHLNRIGYEILRSNKDAGWAIALFKLNTELFPDDGNLWDSLGEAYLKNGQPTEAMRSYETALELAPDEDCHWCKNARQVLKQLREENND